MYPPNHYSSMTDDQLAQWHQLTQRCDQLERDLAESRKATESVQAGAEIERSELKGRLRTQDDLLAKEILERLSLRNAVRRLCAEQVQTLKALRRLVAALEQFHQCDGMKEARDVLDKVTREAKEVIALLDVPFG
jgi:transposase